MHRPTLPALLLLAATLAGATPAPLPAVWIFGEEHDQPAQQAQVAAEVRRLGSEGRLAALVLEMAERGRSTAGLARDAAPEQVREALAWSGWPWETYAEVVMNAVRAGVPVWGGNLPRSENRARMADESLDARVPASSRSLIAQAVRDGHCGLLPAAQEPGMVRVQVARDASMARTVAEARGRGEPAQTVVLLTGAQHASRDRGVPLHLPPLGLDAAAVRVTLFGEAAGDIGLVSDERRAASVTPRPDPCEGLARRLGTPPRP